MITVLFFAQVRELVGEDKLELPNEFSDAEAVRQHLSLRGDKWAIALDSTKLLTAVNQTICSTDTLLKDGDEVAFFPPVTGG
ncbi:molybdopterin synthase sulfur carrier subunit [Photobacterium sp. CCB-ST2H9]|uniref:molybdopterin synthase sulfur carrier subunit n=1 Tax=unclassified Photobacterium TaxID=2628852 RepID=UPI002003DD00|nr:molybdopterin synthase sulfur carrier subunit [Photobacterium sp. CCB-ST2H9]UTM56460.1 molybdopterin synthase sulfur carrier subunit [Photobacterium sp. CCB-ST2H9]